MKTNYLKAALAAVLVFSLALAGCVNQEKQGDLSDEEVAKMVEEFPKKDIRLICPPKQGGLSDFITRLLAGYAEEAAGANVIVENRPGAAGATGMRHGSGANPDGYTVTYVTVESTILKHRKDIDETVSYTDFELLARLNYGPASISVNANSQWQTFGDFVEHAKANPGDVNIGNSGQYSIWHLASAVMADSLGIDVGYVPYDGAAPSVKDLLGGHLDAVVASPSEVTDYVKSGQLRMLAVFSEEREVEMPDVPTAKELNYDIVVGAWGGLGVPLNTPEEIQQKLIEMFKAGFDDPEFQEKCKARSAGANWQDKEAFTEFAAKQDEMFGRVLSDLKME
ncbi:tripartite tricarboxylate transporter substrate binding protein [bacterium]